MAECFGVSRYLILVLGLLLLTLNYSCFIAYNTSFVSLTSSNPVNDANLPLSARRFSFTPTEKGVGFAAPLVGWMVAVLVKAQFLKLFGGHLIFSISSTLATLLVLLTPFSLSWSFHVFTIIRILQGFTVSNLLTLAGMITNSWARLKERGFFIAVLSAHTELGALMTMGSSGQISSILGWPWVFYLHGGVLAALTILWIVYHRDNPEKHPFVGAEELDKINHGKETIKSTEILKVPWLKIFSSTIFWSLLFSIVSYYLVFQFTISFASIYLKQVIGIPSSNVGLIILIPLSVALPVKFTCGYLSDRLKYPELLKIKIFNTIGIMGPAISFFILSATPPGISAVLNIFLVCLPIALLGFSSAGFPKCTILIAGKFTPFVMTIFQMAVGVTCLAVSFIVPRFTANDSVSQWSAVFLAYGLVLSLSNTMFLIFAQSEPAAWSISPVDEPGAQKI